MSTTSPPEQSEYPVTERTAVHRGAIRATYDRELVHSILDEAQICHVGFTTERGPVVIPTMHCRIGEMLYLHGSPANAMLRTLAKGVDVCVTITIVDGLVLARSAFHHSMNYRSVVVFGRAHPIEDLAERSAILSAFVERMAPGRNDELRPHTSKEVKGTSVLALPLEEVSAKVRTGGPIDEPEDLVDPIWAGQVPQHLVFDTPIPDRPVAT